MELFARILMLVCAVFGFAYGAVHYFRKKAALFNQLIVCAVGCMMLGRLYDVVMLLVDDAVPLGFNVGKIAFCGGALFLLSASYGQMDGLVDGKQPELLKYRLIPILAPLSLVPTPIIIFYDEIGILTVIVYAFGLLVVAGAMYFNLKHAIIPDVDFGILKSIRPYNIMTLLMFYVVIAMMIAEATGHQTIWFCLSILLSAYFAAVIPVLKGGSRKWTI